MPIRGIDHVAITVSDVEAVFLAKDGRRIEVEGRVTMRSDDGHPVATKAFLRDVTDRRRDERELSRFFSMSLDLLCVAAFDGAGSYSPCSEAVVVEPGNPPVRRQLRR